MDSGKANKIIAEYMGTRVCGEYRRSLSDGYLLGLAYSESLDSLIPVWEKIDDWNVDYTLRRINGEWHFDLMGLSGEVGSIHIASDTAAMAAAIATAKAIQEIKQ